MRTAPVPGEHGLEVDLHAVQMGLGERGEELPQAALVAAEGAEDGAVDAGRVEAVAQSDGEHRVRADLDEGAVSRGDQSADGLLEAHGLPQVGVPVAGVEGGGVQPVAGQGEERKGISPSRGVRPARASRTASSICSTCAEWEP